jgi:hypothetical protein
MWRASGCLIGGLGLVHVARIRGLDRRAGSAPRGEHPRAGSYGWECSTWREFEGWIGGMGVRPRGEIRRLDRRAGSVPRGVHPNLVGWECATWRESSAGSQGWECATWRESVGRIRGLGMRHVARIRRLDRRAGSAARGEILLAGSEG